MRLFVTVKTAAREEKVEEKDTTHFVVSVKAPPIDGKANIAVAKTLSRHLGVAPSRLSLRSGATSKSKVFVLE